MTDRDNNAMVGALMLVAGGIIGAGLALLFAPQSGARTRKDIVRYARKARCKVEEEVDDFAGNIAEMIEVVGEKAANILEKGKEITYDAKKELLKAVEEGQAQLEKQRARLSKFIG
jgi:gas vesicle protein